MNVKVYPSNINGKINAPSSKSYLHRAIIAASLSEGESRISNVMLSEDVSMTIEAMIKLGAFIKYQDNTLMIRGFKPSLYKLDYVEIDCKQSGSTLRFLIPLCSYLAKKVVFKGKESLFTRPLDEYKRLFNKSNAKFLIKDNTLTINGALLNNDYILSIDKSSQFLTGLLFLSPLFEDNTKINIMDLSSKSISFIKMTLEMIEYFGISYSLTNNVISINALQSFKAKDYICEGDYSLSAFYMLLGLLKGSVTVSGLNLESLQGDKAILDIISKCYGNIKMIKDEITTIKSDIKCINYSIADCIDLGPILTVFSLFGNEQSNLLDAENLIHKESNRVTSMINELNKVNANVSYKDGILTIEPSKLSQKHLVFDTYEDHRIAFALTLLALNLDKPSIIRGVECVNKSYPSFLYDIKNLGVKFEIVD